MIKYNELLSGSSVLVYDLYEFSRGLFSLNFLRRMRRDDPEKLNLIYKLEKMGVKRARNSVRKALSRRGLNAQLQLHR